MELIEHIVFHSIEDTLPLVPFLFITYLALEALEHMAGERAGARVNAPASFQVAFLDELYLATPEDIAHHTFEIEEA